MAVSIWEGNKADSLISVLQSLSDDVVENVDDIRDDTGALKDAFNYNLEVLMSCLRRVAWTDDSANTLLDKFKHFENVPAVTRLYASLAENGENITAGNIDSLIPYLTVIAYYDDNTHQSVVGYTLAGTLATGINTIQIRYGRKRTNIYAYLPSSSSDHIKFALPQGLRVNNNTRIDTGMALDSSDRDYTIVGIFVDNEIITDTNDTTQRRFVDGVTTVDSLYVGCAVFANISNAKKQYRLTCQGASVNSEQYDGDSINTIKFVIKVSYSGNTASLTLSLFVNGTKVNTVRTTRNSSYNGKHHGKTLGVGGIGTYPGNTFDGVSLTDITSNLFRVYDTALSESDINSILEVTI